MATQAQSRISFHKIVDGTTLNFTLTPNLSCTQIKSKDPVSFFPDYTQTKLTITPVLAVSGAGGTNQVKGTCTWYADGSKITSGQNGYTIKTSGDFALELAANPSKASTLIRCDYEYTQPTTGLKTIVTASIALTQVENAGTMIMATILPKNGTIFQTLGGEIKDLVFEGAMIRGGEEDTTNVQYSWEITGTNGNYYAITGATAPAGSGLPGGNLFSGANTKTLTVKSNAVLNIATIRLTCKDIDSASSTFNKTCKAVVSIADITDPYELYLYTPKGTAMSDGNAEGLPVTFIVRQGGTALPDTFYAGKKLLFYRLTEADAKDTSWTPGTSEFPGWAVSAGEVSRTFTTVAATSGTVANRTVYIKPSHMLAGVNTTFAGALDF